MTFNDVSETSATNSHSFRRLICTNCGKTVDVPIFCGDRFCPVCSGPRRMRMARRIGELIKRMPLQRSEKWRFITLTIPNTATPEEGLDILFRAFRRLRQRKSWKLHVRGGVYAAEVTKSDSGWHVHLHCLAVGTFYPQHELAQQWKSCSPGKIVDVRKIPTAAAAAYLTKYVTKSTLPPNERKIASEAYRSRRMYSFFGRCHDVRLPKVWHPMPCTCGCEGCWVPTSSLARQREYDWRLDGLGAET